MVAAQPRLSTAPTFLQNALIAWLAPRASPPTERGRDQLSNLSQYKAVIFASNSRDALWAHGRAIDPTLAVNTATSAYLDAPRSTCAVHARRRRLFVAIHNAFGTEYN
jgi:hypothetical protein